MIQSAQILFALIQDSRHDDVAHCCKLGNLRAAQGGRSSNELYLLLSTPIKIAAAPFRKSLLAAKSMVGEGSARAVALDNLHGQHRAVGQVEAAHGDEFAPI